MPLGTRSLSSAALGFALKSIRLEGLDFVRSWCGEVDFAGDVGGCKKGDKNVLFEA